MTKEDLKRPRVWGSALILIAIAGYWVYHNNASKPDIHYVTATVAKTTLVSALSGTGQVSSENKIDLKSEISGTVVAVPVVVGQQVKMGQTIAQFDARTALVSYNSAKASLESAKANYDKIVAGITSTDLTIAQTSLKSAQLNLDNAKKNKDRTSQQQDILVANALRSLLNSTLTAQPATNNVTTANPTISGTYTAPEQGQYQISLYQSGSGLHYLVNGLETFEGVVNYTSPSPLGSKGLFIQFPANANISDTWTVPIPNTQATNYIANSNAYSAALEARTTALSDADSSIQSAELNVEQAQATFAQKTQAALPSDVAAAQAQVDSAAAQVQSAQITLANATLRAPFDGTISAVSVQRGDQAGSGTLIASLITTGQVAKITLNEVDAAKVVVGQKATLTFDAIDTLTIAGHVAAIDPVGTVTQGVVSYTVTIALDTQNDQIKSGMSVSASIILAAKTDVLAVPSSAVKSQGASNYVDLFAPNTVFTTVAGTVGARASAVPTHQTVVVGMSSDSMIEITSGLQEGDLVATQTVDVNASKTTAASSASSIRIPGLTTGGGAGGAGAARAGGRAGG